MAINKRIIKSNDEGGVVNTDNFNTVLYDGNGTTQSIDNVGFTPDLVWIKNRTVDQGHSLWDTVRGASSGYLVSESTTSELNPQNMLTFDADGFNVSTNGGAYTQTNRNSSNDKYVAWLFKAAGSANTFNVIENGTLSTSSTAGGVGISTSGSNATPIGASINRDNGFGIIKNSIGSSYPQVIAHGYGSKPDMIITKPTTTNEGWLVTVNKNIFGSTYDKQLVLNTNGQASDVTNLSRQITDVHTTLTYTPGNQTFITYMFKSVDGYQKVGSYSGVTGAKTVSGLGFEPRFLIIKRTDNTGDWLMYDSIRGTGVPTKGLIANSYTNEFSDSTNTITFTSDGFEVAGDYSHLNISGGTYIYLAIA